MASSCTRQLCPQAGVPVLDSDPRSPVRPSDASWRVKTMRNVCRVCQNCIPERRCFSPREAPGHAADRTLLSRTSRCTTAAEVEVACYVRVHGLCHLSFTDPPRMTSNVGASNRYPYEVVLAPSDVAAVVGFTPPIPVHFRSSIFARANLTAWHSPCTAVSMRGRSARIARSIGGRVPRLNASFEIAMGERRKPFEREPRHPHRRQRRQLCQKPR